MRKIKAVALLVLLALSFYAAPKAICQGNFPGMGNASAGAVVHLQGTSNTPSVAAGAGAGAGVDAAASLSGTDLAFQLTISADGTPSGSNATIATVTFAQPYASAPFAILTPANANAAALSSTTGCYVTTTATQLLLKSGSSGLSDDTTYVFNVLLSQ